MSELMSWIAGEEDGQALVEYALILVIVSIALVSGLTAMSDALEDIFQGISDKLAQVAADTP